MNIFDGVTTPADESPEESGHEEEAAVNTENEEMNDEDQDDDQDTSTDEDESPDNSGQGEDLLAGKFKTQDDLVKGYQEAQRKLTQLAQQTKQSQTQQPVQQQPNDSGNTEEIFWESFQKNPLGTMQYLIDTAVTNKTAPIYERDQQKVLATNMDPIAKKYAQVRTEEGMSQLFERVNDIAQEMGNPGLAQNPSERVLKMAAEELFGDNAATLFKKAKQAGRQEAEEARRNKQGVAVNTNSKKQQQEAPKTEADLVKENIRNASRPTGIFGL